METKLIIFSAPSGAGKTSIVQSLLKKDLNLAFSVSACSREKRNNEMHGKDYYFIPAEEFRAKIKAGAFLEWEEVYKDHFYGTLKSEVDRLLAEGKNVLFDIDVKGGLNIKKKYGKQALAIFVEAPNTKELERRLRLRGTDSDEKIKQRLNKALYEMSFAPKFDVVLVNNKLEEACAQAEKLVREFIQNND